VQQEWQTLLHHIMSVTVNASVNESTVTAQSDTIITEPFLQQPFYSSFP
jgi:hypothetical protein